MSKMSKTIAILGVVAGLGVAALPLSSYAAPTAIPGTTNTDGKLEAEKDVPVQLTIEETLNMYVTNEAGDADFTSPVKINGTGTDGAIVAAGQVMSDPIAVKVETANKDGYQLTIVGSADTNPTSLTNDNNTEIAAGDLTDGTKSEWGYMAVDSEGTFGTTWTGVSTTAAPINKLTTAGTQTTKVKFGANIIAGQQAGTYNGQVTFTATAGPSA